MLRPLGNIQEGMLIVIMVTILICLSGCGPSWTVVRAYDGPKKPVEETAIVFAHGPLIIVTAIDNKPCECKYMGAQHDNIARLCEWHLLPGKHSITAHCEVAWGHEFLDYRVVSWMVSASKSSTVSMDFEKGCVYELISEGERPHPWRFFIVKKGTLGEYSTSPEPILSQGQWPYWSWEDAPRHWRDLRAEQHQKRN